MAREIMIRVVGDARSARKALGDTATAAGRLGDNVQRRVRPATSTLNRFWREARRVAAPLGGVALAAQTMFAGFNRVRQIDDARAKLAALGHDTASTAAIMDSALESVTGTAFSLADAATAASTAVAAGIQPGEELTRYLSLTADAAHVAGASLDDMADIVNKTTTNAKVTTREMNQLAQRGLPIWQWLADQYGVTAEELRKMVSQGKVDSAALLDAIETNIGGAAKSANDSWSGLVSNLGAAQARLGAAVIDPLFRLSKAVLPSVIEGVDLLTDGITFLGGFLQGDGLPLAAAAAAMATFTTAAKFAAVQVPLLTTRVGLAALAIRQKVTALMSIAAAHPVLTAVTLAAGALTFAWTRGRQAAAEKRKETNDLAQEIRRLGDAYDATVGKANELVTESDDLRTAMLHAGLGADDLAAALSGSEEDFDRFVAAVVASAEASGIHELTSKALTDGLERQRDITQDAIDKADELGDVVSDTADETEDAISPTDRLGRTWKTAAEKAEDAKEALNELKREMDDYLDRVFGGVNAESRWFDSLDRLTAEVKEHGTTLDLTNEAGRRNEDTLQRLVSAGKDRLEQMIDDKATTVEVRQEQNRLADELEEVMRQMGFTAEEAETYADRLRDIPTRIVTRFELDTGAAERAAERMRTISENLPGRSLASVMHQGRATGGPVQGGEWYMVGERGRELAYMPRDGQVFSHGVTERVLAGVGAASAQPARPSETHITIDAGGLGLSAQDVETLADVVARRIGWQSGAGV